MTNRTLKSISEKKGVGNSVPLLIRLDSFLLVEKTAVFHSSIIQAERKHMDLFERSRI